MWGIFRDSKAMGKAPSAMLGILNPYAAYCFDEACLAFGAGCEGVMDAVRTKGKSEKHIRGAKENALRKVLGLEQKYADIRAARPPAADRPDPPFDMEK